jgi:hypothetical protein
MNMQDPMSQMAQAQKLSITQLQQALRDGTINPQVGQIVLASKISQDKQAKMSMAAQAPKQPPVAQQNMAYGQGVPALPTNLPAQGMAGGGIISFAEGGTYGSDDYDPTAMEQDYRTKANAQYNDYLSNKSEFGPSVLFENAKQKYDAYQLKANNKTPYDDAINYYDSINNPTGSYQAKMKRAEWLKNPTNLMENAAKAGQAQVLPKAGITPAVAAPPVDKKNTPPVPEADIRAQYAGSKSTRGNAPQSASGIDAFKINPAKFDDTYLNKIVEGDNNPATGKPWTDAEITAKRRVEEGAAGIKDIYSGQETELQALKDKYAKGSKLDEAMPFFAAAEALTRQPKAGEAPSSFIGSLASGLGAYGKSKGELTDKQEARQDKIRTESNQLAQAKNAFAQAQLSGDRAEIKSAQDSLDSHYKALSDFGIKKSEATALAEAESKKLELQNTMNERSVGAQYYAANKAQNVITGIAAKLRKDDPNMTESEAIEKAYQISNPGFGATAQRDVASQRAGITKSISDLQKKYPLGMKMSPEDLALYNSYNQQLKVLGSQGGAESATPVANPYAGFSQIK